MSIKMIDKIIFPTISFRIGMFLYSLLLIFDMLGNFSFHSVEFTNAFIVFVRKRLDFANLIYKVDVILNFIQYFAYLICKLLGFIF